MGRVFNKETVLSIKFTDNGLDKRDNMNDVMKLLGAPKFKIEFNDNGWDITAPNGKTLRVYSKSIKNFITETTFSTVVAIVEREYVYSSFANKYFIQEHIFGNSNEAGLSSEIGTVWSNSIGIKTIGTDTTRTKVSNLHRKNVLVLKDKIVAMEHVHSVTYTCEWKSTSESECSV